MHCFLQDLVIGGSLGIVIRAGASTGGMDIPPLVLNLLFQDPGLCFHVCV